MLTRRPIAHRTAPHRALESGFSLIDGLIATSVVAILAGIAATSAGDSRARQQLVGAAGEFETHMHHAKTIAAATNAAVRISFEALQEGACYVLHTGSSSDCTCQANGSVQCSPDVTALRVVYFDASSGLRVASNVKSMTIDPARGTVSPAGTVRFAATNGAAVHQVVNVWGRVRSCSPTPGLAGVNPC
jgi:type IV fimbrial biogenesis protein FimT